MTERAVKVYVDSNVFFYAKIMDKVFGKACAEVIRRIASGGLDASTSVLATIEVANAMRKYGLSDDVAAEIRAIFSLGIPVYPVDPADAREAVEIFEETRISPYDCVHAAIMRKNSIKQIISADKEFDRLAWLERVDPRPTGETKLDEKSE